MNFTTRLFLVLAGLSGVLITRLYMAAETHNNWPGFYYSTLHVLVVAAGSFYLLKETSSESGE